MPILPGSSSNIEDASGSGTYSQNLTSSSSAHTKGAYSQLIASTSFEVAWVLLQMPGGNAGLFLVDIATGAASSEAVLIPNLIVQQGTGFFSSGVCMMLPVGIASGTRIAARCQSNGSSLITNVSLTLFGGTPSGQPGECVQYGVNTGTTRGTSIDPGGSANTKGSWTQIAASTSAATRWIVVQVGGQGNAAAADFEWNIDIGTGAAASEVVLVPDLYFGQSSTEVTSPTAFCLPVAIAAGTRLSARAKCSGTDATDRLIDVAILACTEEAGSVGGATSYAFCG